MNAKKLFATLAIGLGAFFYAVNTFAADSVSIKVTGKIISLPCTTVNGGAATKSVSLGDSIGADTLSKAGSGSTKVLFEIPVTGCPAGTTNVKATFSGTADPDSIVRWKNTAANPAPNTAVEITNQSNGNLVYDGSTLDAPVSSGNATFKLQARAYSPDGSAKPGDIEAVVVATFEYQ